MNYIGTYRIDFLWIIPALEGLSVLFVYVLKYLNHIGT